MSGILCRRHLLSGPLLLLPNGRLQFELRLRPSHSCCFSLSCGSGNRRFRFLLSSMPALQLLLRSPCSIIPFSLCGLRLSLGRSCFLRPRFGELSTCLYL